MAQSLSSLLERQQARTDWLLLGYAAVLGLLALYLVGFDQGFLLALFQGHSAYDVNMFHELIHDSRHIAAFPCH
jgi:hypothetical protein